MAGRMAKRASKAKTGRPVAKKADVKAAAKASTSPAGRPAASLPAAMRTAAVPEGEVLTAAAAAITKALSKHDLESIPQPALQQLISAVVRAYSAKTQAGEQFLPFEFNSKRVSPTDVMLTCSGLLKAADLQVFELGMWQSFTGR